jgi:hypothetical protein
MEDGKPAVVLTMPPEFLELQKALISPSPLKEGWTPENGMKKYMPDSQGEESAKLAAEINKCKSLLALESSVGNLGGIDYAAVKKQLAAFEKDLAKVEKDTPNAAVSACQLRLAKQEYGQEDKKRMDAAEAGAQKAAEKVVRLQAICQAHIDAWQAVSVKVDRETVDRLALWATRRDETSNRRNKVLQEFDSMIAAAEARQAAENALGGVAPLQQQQQQPQEQPTAEEAAAAANDKAVKLAFAQLHHTVELCKEELVALKDAPPPCEEYKPVLATMHHWAQASFMGETAVPFSFQQMGATTDVCFSLVGKKVWDKVFAAEVAQGLVIADTAICPLQLRQVIFMQLQFYHTTLVDKQYKKQEKIATDLLAKASEEWSKKRKTARCSPYS